MLPNLWVDCVEMMLCYVTPPTHAKTDYNPSNANNIYFRSSYLGKRTNTDANHFLNHPHHTQ